MEQTTISDSPISTNNKKSPFEERKNSAEITKTDVEKMNEKEKKLHIAGWIVSYVVDTSEQMRDRESEWKSEKRTEKEIKNH